MSSCGIIETSSLYPLETHCAELSRPMVIQSCVPDLKNRDSNRYYHRGHTVLYRFGEKILPRNTHQTTGQCAIDRLPCDASASLPSAMTPSATSSVATITARTRLASLCMGNEVWVSSQSLTVLNGFGKTPRECPRALEQ